MSRETAWPPKLSEFAVRLGELVREARASRGLSQLALANEVGVTQTLVSQWERGVGQPNAEHLVAVMRLLDISLEAVAA